LPILIRTLNGQEHSRLVFTKYTTQTPPVAENIQQMPGLFQSVAVFALVAGGIILLFAKPLRKWMGGIQ